MIKSHRTSPIDRLLQPLQGTWHHLNEMPTLISTVSSNQTASTIPLDTSRSPSLNLADLSCLTRFGVKGSGASAWLASQTIPIPDRPNTWLPLANGGLVARLGLSEFLIEDSLSDPIAPLLAAACHTPPEAVYPVLRQDLAIALVGTAIPDLLLQTCSVNFQALELSDRPVVLTSMAGVAVTVLPGERQSLPFYRIWCDGTFGVYLWRTLEAIAAELSGAVVGFDQMHPLIGMGDRDPATV